MIPAALARRLPILDWGRPCDRRRLGADRLAAAIVTVMLVPQSLTYAMLAGRPPETGNYAGVAPILLCTVFGTSRAPAVGPVAVVSLMTAAALGEVAAQGTAGYADAALTLAPLSSGFLPAMGALRLGVLTHPVIAGVMSAAAIVIAAGQLRHLLGVRGGETRPGMVASLTRQAEAAHLPTPALGLAAGASLAWVRRGRKPALAVAANVLLTLGLGVEAGAPLSLALHFAHVARPHVAEVELVPGIKYVRNLRRHRAETGPEILSVRNDESLIFLSACQLEDRVLGRIADSPVQHVVLTRSAVGAVELSTLETLESLNQRLRAMGIALHLSEVKGLVMDCLGRAEFLRDLTGRVVLSHVDALRQFGAVGRVAAA